MRRWAPRVAMTYVALGLVSTFVGIAGAIKAEPLKLSTGWSVTTDALLGIGTGISAPWPLLAVTLVASGRVRGHHGLLWQRVLGVLSGTFLVGALVEPVTWRGLRQVEDGIVATVAALNVALPVLLLLAASSPRLVTIPERSADSSDAS